MEKQSEYIVNLKPFNVGLAQSSNINTEGTEGVYRGLRVDSRYDSTPEDKQTPCSVADDSMFIQEQEIETQWTRVKTSLKILRNLYAERADEEFLSRAKSLMEGMK